LPWVKRLKKDETDEGIADMNYLVTGGAGFVGSHLCDVLLSKGHRVTAIDDLSTGSARNIAHLRGHDRFSARFASVFERELVAELVDEADVVVHLAAAVGVKLIVHSPVHTIETNVSGTERVLQFASKKGKKVLIASTSEVYGKASKIPFCEDDDMVLGPTCRSRWSYACSKALDEFLALSYYHERHTPVVIVRLFNTVGPRQTGHYGMVVPRFVEQALNRQPITVYGDGNQSRCFGYVGDVVTGIVRLCEEPRAVGEIFNLGSDEEITINQLAELVREVTGSTSDIVHIPYEQAYAEGFEDMMRRVPSLRKASRLIDYRPTLRIRDIVEKVAASLSGDCGASVAVG
jgi:UDP-glucose 4-epimerase